MAILGSNYLQTNYIAPSSFAQNGGIIQTVCKDITTQVAQPIYANTHTTVSNTAALIYPKRQTSSILIYVRWCFEVTSLYTCNFGLLQEAFYGGVDLRNTQIGLPPYLSAQLPGITCGMDTYSANAANDQSTPAQMNFWYRDTVPSGVQSLTYRPTVMPSTNRTLYLNRTILNSNTTAFELLTSAIYLFEVSG